jgi:hypothetical protein
VLFDLSQCNQRGFEQQFLKGWYSVRRPSCHIMPIKLRPKPLVALSRLLTNAWKSFSAKRAAANELANCGSLEVARIAQDLGISNADLYVIAARDKTAVDLLNRRLESLRLDPTSIDPAVMRDLQRCCSNCNSKQMCVHELEDQPKVASWPKYCPNELTIAALATDPTLPPSLIVSRLARLARSTRDLLKFRAPLPMPERELILEEFKRWSGAAAFPRMLLRACGFSADRARPRTFRLTAARSWDNGAPGRRVRELRRWSEPRLHHPPASDRGWHQTPLDMPLNAVS